MKIYIIDDSEVERDPFGNLLSKDIISIVHHESTDFIEPGEIPRESIQWSEQLLLLELVQGNKVIGGVPGVELVRDRHYLDGRIERITAFQLDVTALYALYQHLKNIDERNPDGLMW